MALIGYGVGSSYHHVMKGFSYAGYLLLGAAVIAIVVVIAHRYRRYKELTASGGPARPAPAGGPARPAPARHAPAHRRGTTAVSDGGAGSRADDGVPLVDDNAGRPSPEDQVAAVEESSLNRRLRP
jgi:hypothetical protein